MPSLDATNIQFNVLKVEADKGVTVGLILLGTAKPVHVLSLSATVHRIFNMTALLAGSAQAHAGTRGGRSARAVCQRRIYQQFGNECAHARLDVIADGFDVGETVAAAGHPLLDRTAVVGIVARAIGAWGQ